MGENEDYLNLLPQEIWLILLGYLSTKDLLQFSWVSRQALHLTCLQLQKEIASLPAAQRGIEKNRNSEILFLKELKNTEIIVFYASYINPKQPIAIWTNLSQRVSRSFYLSTDNALEAKKAANSIYTIRLRFFTIRDKIILDKKNNFKSDKAILPEDIDSVISRDGETKIIHEASQDQINISKPMSHD